MDRETAVAIAAEHGWRGSTVLDQHGHAGGIGSWILALVVVAASAAMLAILRATESSSYAVALAFAAVDAAALLQLRRNELDEDEMRLSVC